MLVELSSQGLQIINLVIAVLIPLLVALVTNRLANGAVKSLTLIVLNVLLAIFTEWADDGSFVVFDSVLLFFQGFLVAVAAHYGALKPLSLSGSNGSVAAKVPQGIGADSKAATPDRKV